MIISEKQILTLIRLAEGYANALHRFGEYKTANELQGLLATINDQQSEALKEIKDDV
jgi:hypothetical protein